MIDYIEKNYGGSDRWFEEEVKLGHHISRIAKTVEHKNFLDGKNHEVSNRRDITYKGETFHTSKMVLQTIKPILLFHNSYIIGKRISLVGSINKVREFNKIYRNGKFFQNDYKLVDALNKYGDAYEYIYMDYHKKIITSKILDSANSYPVFDEYGNYIAFIEHYRDNKTNDAIYIVYSENEVITYSSSNEGKDLDVISTNRNISGLPVHYNNGNNDKDVRFGKSMIEDIRPLIEKIELLLSKLDDAVYVHSLSPLAYTTGMQIEGSMDADIVGHYLALEEGEFKFAIANLDTESIKFLYETLMQQLTLIGCVPSHLFGQNNISNVSEVSLKLLFQTLSNKSDLLVIHLRDGFTERFEKIEKLLNYLGIKFDDSEYIDVEFNYSKPVNTSELLSNLQIQREIGAISRQTIIEKSEYTNDVEQEMERLSLEQSSDSNIVKPLDKVFENKEV